MTTSDETDDAAREGRRALAPERFAHWMSAYEHVDRRYGHVYRYHSRGDAHSKALCREILADLLRTCPTLRAHALRGVVVYGINTAFTWPATGKSKTLDLAIGPPATPDTASPEPGQAIAQGRLGDVLIACEAKAVMTEHTKSRPRLFDELSSSHEIVHQGRQDAIAAGITVVNIAPTFVSPLRQTAAGAPVVSTHRQPAAAEGMIGHLRGLPIRDAVGQVGFDAYCTFLVDADNVGPVRPWTAPPAPQPGDRDHYITFLERLGRLYTERFGALPPAR